MKTTATGQGMHLAFDTKSEEFENEEPVWLIAARIRVEAGLRTDAGALEVTPLLEAATVGVALAEMRAAFAVMTDPESSEEATRRAMRRYRDVRPVVAPLCVIPENAEAGKAMVTV